ncbi:hypothetical protein SBA3_4910009 [Candidatus Sulfopaludibacter sp. SbA3]|nr:hypothetical protein SBA3_4910009 [Candidatus Sulfopaludibacter sp. SbA3]
MTNTLWPATVMVPVRRPPVLIPTVYVTGPLPVPLFPLLTRIHDALAVAFQPQSGALAVTVRLLPVAPAAATETLLGLTAKEQVTPD